MNPDPPVEPLMEDPNALLEKAIIEEYLRSRGLTLEALEHLPKRTRTRLMTEASRYASLKLTELEARAHLVDEVHAAHKEKATA
jgi:hypothetical protein